MWNELFATAFVTGGATTIASVALYERSKIMQSNCYYFMSRTAIASAVLLWCSSLGLIWS